MKVIGFEGSWPTDVGIAWGPAAVKAPSGQVLNSLTGRTIGHTDWRALVAAGHATQLPSAIEIREEYHKAHLIALALRESGRDNSIFIGDAGRVPGLVGSHRGRECVTYVFGSLDSFHMFALDCTSATICRLLSVGNASEDTTYLLQCALILTPDHPELHALRVFFARDPIKSRATSLVRMTTPDSLRRFEAMERALSATPDNLYWLSYQHGVAEGGGLDSDQVAQQFTALAAIHQRLRQTRSRRYPFLPANDNHPYRLNGMKTASAHLGFGVSVKGETLLQKVTRYYDLELLQEAIEGGLAEEDLNDQKLQASLERVCRPSLETKVAHTRLGKDSETEIHFSAPPQETFHHDRKIAVLCGVEGVYRRLRKVELRLSPTRTETLSTFDNGFGDPPEGATLFDGNANYFFRPATARLNSFIGENRRKYGLDEISLLEVGQSSFIDAVPSFLLKDAVFVGATMQVTRTSEYDWMVGDVKLSPVIAPTHSQLEAWLRQAAVAFRRHELEHGLEENTTWLRPSRQTTMRALHRLVLALGLAGGRMLIPDLLTEVQRIGGAPVRKNNTRRELMSNPEWVTTSEDDSDTAMLTPQGQVLAAVLSRMLRASQQAHATDTA